jgi:hypothetical protein
LSLVIGVSFADEAILTPTDGSIVSGVTEQPLRHPGAPQSTNPE